MEALERKAPIHFVAAFLLTSLTQAQCYETSVLVGPDCPIFGDPGIVYSKDLNDDGVILGFYNTDCFGLEGQPFFWTIDDGYHVIESLLEYPSIGVQALSDSNQVVGMVSTSLPGFGVLPFFLDGSRVQVLGTLPGGNYGQFEALNDVGSAVGVWGNSISGPGSRALLWQGGRLIDFGAQIPATYSRASDINDAGQIIGTMSNDGNAYTGFLYHDGQVVEFLPLPDTYSSGTGGINQAGEVVGSASMINDAGNGLVHRAFHWAKGTYTIFEPPDGYASIGFGDLNDHGDIIGAWFNPGQSDHVFALWRADGAIIDLNAVIPDEFDGYTQVQLKGAIAINNSGQILGFGLASTGTFLASVGMLLTPIDTTGDVTGDCRIDASDLGELLRAWGACQQSPPSEAPSPRPSPRGRGGCAADLTGDDQVDGADLGTLLLNWSD